VDLSDNETAASTTQQPSSQMIGRSSNKPTGGIGTSATTADASFSSSRGGVPLSVGAAGHPLLPPLQLLRRIAEITGTPYFFEQVVTSADTSTAGYHQFAVKGDFGKASVVETGATMEEAKTNAAVRILLEMGIEAADAAPSWSGGGPGGEGGGQMQQPPQQPPASIVPPPAKRHAPQHPMGGGPQPMGGGLPPAQVTGAGMGGQMGGWARNNYNEVLYRQGKQGYW